MSTALNSIHGVLLVWFLTTPPTSYPVARQQHFDPVLAAPHCRLRTVPAGLDLNSVILTGPFQLKTFYDSMILSISASSSTPLQHGHKQSCCFYLFPLCFLYAGLLLGSPPSWKVTEVPSWLSHLVCAFTGAKSGNNGAPLGSAVPPYTLGEHMRKGRSPYSSALPWLWDSLSTALSFQGLIMSH